eukprot:scaffold13488_cov57-Phaeocystis_antarctica.AAC.2
MHERRQRAVVERSNESGTAGVGDLGAGEVEPLELRQPSSRRDCATPSSPTGLPMRQSASSAGRSRKAGTRATSPASPRWLRCSDCTGGPLHRRAAVGQFFFQTAVIAGNTLVTAVAVNRGSHRGLHCLRDRLGHSVRHPCHHRVPDFWRGNGHHVFHIRGRPLIDSRRR